MNGRRHATPFQVRRPHRIYCLFACFWSACFSCFFSYVSTVCFGSQIVRCHNHDYSPFAFSSYFSWQLTCVYVAHCKGESLITGAVQLKIFERNFKIRSVCLSAESNMWRAKRILLSKFCIAQNWMNTNVANLRTYGYATHWHFAERVKVDEGKTSERESRKRRNSAHCVRATVRHRSRLAVRLLHGCILHTPAQFGACAWFKMKTRSEFISFYINGII